MEKELRAGPRRSKHKFHTTALAGGRASSSLTAPKGYKVPYSSTGGSRQADPRHPNQVALDQATSPSGQTDKTQAARGRSRRPLTPYYKKFEAHPIDKKNKLALLKQFFEVERMLTAR